MEDKRYKTENQGGKQGMKKRELEEENVAGGEETKG